MSKITEVRLTLAAFIYGIEIDLKNTLKNEIGLFQNDLNFFQNKQLEDKVIERFNKENPGIDYRNSIVDVIDFLDFGDILPLLKKNSSYLRKETLNYLNSIQKDIETILPIRNRVMHSRPLLGGDFGIVYEFVHRLLPNNPIDWRTAIENRNLIEKDPSYVLTLKFPTSTFILQGNKVEHNLPIPDFDETGFIGREKDVRDVTQLVLSNKVVTVIGDGGIGKTALALKVAYDIVDLDENCPFELVIWTTAKTTMLTSKGIEEIYCAITDYSGLIENISEVLISSSEKDKLETILENLDYFKTLLILDNFETIHNEQVREFIRKAQVKCNILITSRIGLGELEFPRKLNGLSETEASNLIRQIASIRNSEILVKMPNKKLIEFSEKLYYNPLALKWFVNTVEMGISPQQVLANKEDLLNFCLTNVYEKLSPGAIEILNTIRASRRKLTTGELVYLTSMGPINVRKYVSELYKTTLVNRELKDFNNLEEVYFYISEFAKDFLSNKYELDGKLVQTVIQKIRTFEAGLKDISKHGNYNEFSINSLFPQTVSQKVAARFLFDALRFSKERNFEMALQKVSEAKNIDPSYSEVYRVSAFIKATKEDLLGAEEDYTLGLEISPKNVRLLFYYSQFLLFTLGDVDKALKYAERVYELRPNHIFTSLLFARCYKSNKDFGNAIHILKSILSLKGLNTQNERTTLTELISCYHDFGRSLLEIETDIENAISHFKKAFLLFEDALAKENIDYKLIKHFVECLHSFICIIPNLEVENNKQFIKNIFVKYQKYICLIPLHIKMIQRYSTKFSDTDFNSILKGEISLDKKIGSIAMINVQTNYAFIESDKDKIYANRYDFIDLQSWLEWKSLKTGQLVSFEMGTNQQGQCAKNILLIR